MTPTSGTGSEGFTLVEVLVVVVIIALAGALTVLALPDPRPSLVSETERFAATLAKARDQAVLTNRVAAVRVDADGYALTGADPVAWAEGDTVTILTPDGAGAPAASLSFDPTGVVDPATLTLRRGDARAQVSVDQAGQVRVDAQR